MSSARGDSLPLLSHFGRKSVAVIVVTCALALSHKATLARAKKQISRAQGSLGFVVLAALQKKI